MSKKNEACRSQPEFFFVFDSESKTQSAPDCAINSADVSECKALSPDVAKIHRDRLIEELREFGC